MGAYKGLLGPLGPFWRAPAPLGRLLLEQTVVLELPFIVGHNTTPVRVCVRVRIYVHICINVRVSIYIYVHVHIYIYACVQLSVYVSV